jgi:signal transduction histidine kinase
MIASRPRILAIDDTPANLLTLGAALSAEYDFQVAKSGPDGLALANASPPDLVLLDVMMPGMDGYEVCRRISQTPALRSIPVIFVTALADMDAEVAGLTLGAADYLTKPINVTIAKLRIGNLLERVRLKKELEAQRDHLEDMVQARTAALVVAKEAAEAASRAKTVFLANMSHELRTPLSQVMGMTSLAQRRATDPRQGEQLAKSMEASHRLLRVINDVIDIAEIEANKITLESVAFNLGRVLKKVHAVHEREAKAKGLELSFEADPELEKLELIGDPHRFAQIMHTLVGNAIKFSDSGRVLARVHSSPADVACIRLQIEVEDRGIGIATEDQARIFKAFEQQNGSITRRHGGSGLGLAICKDLATRMGGGIALESVPGQGSVFRVNVLLQLNQQASASSASAESAFSILANRHAKASLLLLEDEPVSRELLSSAVENAGLEVVALADPGAVLETMKRLQFSWLVIDIDMPGLNPVELARSVKSLPSNGNVRILAISSDSYSETARTCLGAGMAAFLTKPIDSEALYEALVNR